MGFTVSILTNRMPLRTKFVYFFAPYPIALAGFLMLGGALNAQMGVAPSQNGMFFNDIRNRASQVREGFSSSAPSGPTTGTEGSYTFEESQYLGLPVDQRALGSSQGLDVIARPVGTPMAAGGARTSAYSRRLANDNTGYNGPYPSANTFFAPTYVSDPFLAGKRNLKVGPVNIGMGLTGALEYNDNVLRASTYRPPALTAATGTSTPSGADAVAPRFAGKVDDMIASAYLNLDVNYPISAHNRLSLTASIGVSHYFYHPELAPNGDGFSLTILPGTALSFDFKVGNVVFTLYDRMSVQPASQDAFALDNSDIFGNFQNDAGIAMNWAINSELNLSLNLNNSILRALQNGTNIAGQNRFQQYDRTVNSLSGSLAWTPSGTWTVGLEGSYSNINYKEDYNNDGNTLSGGVFVVLPVTRNTMVRVAGGMQSFDFKTPPLFNRTVTDQSLTATQNTITNLNAQIAAINVSATDPTQAQAAQTQLAALQTQLTQAQDTLTKQTATKASEDVTAGSRTFDRTNKLNDYYYNVIVSNQLNSRVSQQLSFGHESSLNNTSDLITADYVSYGLGIIAWRGARITLSGYYEDSTESGGNLKEDVKQFGFDVNLTHRLGEHLTAGVGYHYGNINSDLPLRDYDQNSFTVDLNYQMNAKWMIGLGYQLWKTNADDPTQTFTQNRVILSTNYSF
jgi:hypothetical protein